MKKQNAKARCLTVMLVVVVWCLALCYQQSYAIELRSGFPIWSDELGADEGEVGHSMVNYDYDGDGEVETIVGKKGVIYFIDSQSNVERLFDTGAGECSPPSIGDIDGDGEIEIVFAGKMDVAGQLYPAIYVISPDMTTKPPFPVQICDRGLLRAPPVLYDLDGDGYQEILFGTFG
jgi:hypothetical protein